MLLSMILILFSLIGCLKAGLTDYVTIVNRDCYGNDIQNISNANTDNCAKKCDQTEHCVGFVIHSNTSTCNLKSKCYFLSQNTDALAFLIPQDGCLAGWTRYDKHCYKFVLDERKNAHDASGYCRNTIPEGHLVSINDREEFDFLNSTIQAKINVTGGRQQIWTSGVRVQNDSWMWHNHDSFFELFKISDLWRIDEPSGKNGVGSIENNIALDLRHEDVGLNDENENTQLPYICETENICPKGYWGINCTHHCEGCLGQENYTRDIILTAVFSFIAGCLVLFVTGLVIWIYKYRLPNTTAADVSTAEVTLNQVKYTEDDLVYENEVDVNITYENLQRKTQKSNTDNTYQPLKKR